jgi:small subunit ribosomal protein S1
VHISELAQQHVENPREIVQPGDDIRVRILEIDSERRRLSLSIKRVEDQILPRRTPEAAAGDLDDMPELGLSEDVFTSPPEGGDEGVTEAEAASDAEAGSDAATAVGPDAAGAPDVVAEPTPDPDEPPAAAVDDAPGPDAPSGQP